LAADKPANLAEAMKYYNDRISDLEIEVTLKDEEIAALKQRLSDFASMGTETAKGEAILNGGDERDLYPGEAREIVLDSLAEYRKQLGKGTRRSDVLDDILAHNAAKGIPKQKAKQLKDALKGFTALNSSIRQKLNEIGFDISERPNKHYRLKYYGDDRYKATMACSGGDKLRGGRNLAAELILNML